MSWYDPTSWSNPFNAPMRGSGQPGADQANYTLPGAQQRDAQLGGMVGNAGQRQAPQAAQSSFRGGQQDLAGYLSSQMQGQNSVAQQQLRQATDRNMSQQQALAQSARPGMAAQAALQASQNAGMINAGYAGQASLAGIQERNAAAQGLGGVLSSARGLDNQLALGNAGMQIQQSGQNDAFQQALLNQQLQNAQLQQQGSMAYEQNNTVRRGQDMSVPSWGEGLIGGATGLIGSAMSPGGLLSGGGAAPAGPNQMVYPGGY